MESRSTTARATSPEIEAFVRLVRASFTVTRELSAQLSCDHDLSLNEYEALLTLARAPGSRMRRVDLANTLLLTAGGVTRLLDGLERQGFVAREESPSDRRVSYAALTKVGRDKLRAADKSHTRQIRELLGAQYDEAELTQLAALLDRLLDAGPADDAC
jgi:DNA-binding MarR family transcriptional regulator